MISKEFLAPCFGNTSNSHPNCLTFIFNQNDQAVEYFVFLRMINDNISSMFSIKVIYYIGHILKPFLRYSVNLKIILYAHANNLHVYTYYICAQNSNVFEIWKTKCFSSAHLEKDFLFFFNEKPSFILQYYINKRNPNGKKLSHLNGKGRMRRNC